MPVKHEPNDEHPRLRCDPRLGPKGKQFSRDIREEAAPPQAKTSNDYTPTFNRIVRIRIARRRRVARSNQIVDEFLSSGPSRSVRAST